MLHVICTRLFFIAILVFSLVHTSAPSQATPSAMVGNSFIINWSESRQIRRNGRNWKRKTIRKVARGYVGTKKTVFIRVIVQAGSSDRVGDASNRKRQWRGNSLIITRAMGSGGALRLVAKFNSSFTSCSVRAVIAFEPGKKITLLKRNIGGPGLEILNSSWRVSGRPTCKVVKGNIHK